jgi:hypothetical protein
MKKLMIFMLIGCLALLVSSSIFANSGAILGDKESATIKDTATLYAYVTPYASINFNLASCPPKLLFDGTPNQTKKGWIGYALETNCNVNVDGFGTAFKGVNHPEDSLATSYKCVPADSFNLPPTDANLEDPAIDGWRQVTDSFVWAPEGFDHKWAKDYVGSYWIGFKAQTGEKISSQRAGEYTASYTVTVWSPQDLN